MIARVERELGINVAVRTLVEGRTIRRIASLLANPTSSLLPPGVVCVRDGDLNRPLFCLPGIGGDALQATAMMAKLRTRRALYAIELYNLDVKEVRVGDRLPKPPMQSYGVSVRYSRRALTQSWGTPMVEISRSRSPGC